MREQRIVMGVPVTIEIAGGKAQTGRFVSVTVLGPNVYEADRFATAAFAMGSEGIHFIEELPRFEGYLIDRSGIATMTTGFADYAVPCVVGPGSRMTP